MLTITRLCTNNTGNLLNLPNPHISHKNSTMVGHYFPKFNMENGVVFISFFLHMNNSAVFELLNEVV